MLNKNSTIISKAIVYFHFPEGRHHCRTTFCDGRKRERDWLHCAVLWSRWHHHPHEETTIWVLRLQVHVCPGRSGMGLCVVCIHHCQYPTGSIWQVLSIQLPEQQRLMGWYRGWTKDLLTEGRTLVLHDVSYSSRYRNVWCILRF